MGLAKNIEETGDIFISPNFTSFNDMIEWSLLLMECKGITGLVHNLDGRQIEFGFTSIKTYDGAILLPGGQVDDGGYAKSHAHLLQDDYVKLGDFDNDLTGAKLFSIYKGQGCHFLKLRKLDQKELRGTPHIGKSIIELSLSFLQNNGKWVNTRVHFWQRSSAEKDIFTLVIISTSSKRLKDDGLDTFIQPVLRMHFANYYQWFVYIKEKNDLGVRIPIGLDSIESVFHLKDLKVEGRKRAIIHWVKQHHRMFLNNKELDDYTFIKVKQHLRGETKFNWDGLQINIIPSRYDIKRVGSKNKKYIEV